MMRVDQIKAGDVLLEELNDRDVAMDVSIRDLIESLVAAGLVLATAPRSETSPALDALDRMDV